MWGKNSIELVELIPTLFQQVWGFCVLIFDLSCKCEQMMEYWQA